MKSRQRRSQDMTWDRIARRVAAVPEFLRACVESVKTYLWPPMPGSIHVIYTGGTIGGVVNGEPIDIDRRPQNFKAGLLKRLPGWTTRFKWSTHSPYQKLSENITPDDWTDLASMIDSAVRAGATGVVVAHGTDTLIYSSIATALMLRNIQIPVVFTGSNLPLEEEGTDAIQNVAHAMIVAASGLKGVVISFAGVRGKASLVLDPLFARKRAARLDCFQSMIEGHIGRVIDRWLVWQRPRLILDATGADSFRQRNGEGDYAPSIALETRVAFFKLFPGFNPALIDAAVEQGVKGILLSCYGSGTCCAEGPLSITGAVRGASAKGVPVYALSQHYGDVVFGRYGSSEQLHQAGAKGLDTCTPEAAVVRLMWALAHCDGPDELDDLMHNREK